MQLKNYQEKAIDELLKMAKELLGYSEPKKLVFRAPTGSGKTIMIAEFLKMLVNDIEIKQRLSFIWTAPRKLHEQSKNKLESYYSESRALRCSFFEDLDDRKIGEGEVLFFNWESINKEDNIYIRENEQDNNLSKVLENTREEGRKVVLIIDEVHFGAYAEAADKLRQDIDADLTIEVSATPVIANPDGMVNVALENVKAEGMIKRAVVLNPDLENTLKNGKIDSKLSNSSEDWVIELALRKRNWLAKAYEKEDANINPLVLIQLPDRKSGMEDEIRFKVEQILKDKHKISRDNGKLAVYLSEDKENLENIVKPDNEVEVMIFKQAIALGWDCPRAQILVLFREWHSPIFSIQTVGRIMRMPELRHYTKHENLNYGYVFTNLGGITIEEDIARDYITTHTSKRKSEYKDIDLLSCYRERHREITRLAPRFIEIFLDVAKKRGLKEKVDTSSRKVSDQIISDGLAEDIDLGTEGLKIKRQADYSLKIQDLEKIFKFWISQALMEKPVSFHPDSEGRSVGQVREAIYRFFESEFLMEFGSHEAIQIALSDKNAHRFLEVLGESKEIYKMEKQEREEKLVPVIDWNVHAEWQFNSNCEQMETKKSIMEPFYSYKKSDLERRFIAHIDKSFKVKWWFKNGDRDATFFAVPYKEGGKELPFYVDFIVMLNDGKIGLFDTKSGLTLKVAGTKIDGLYKYIQQENKKGKKLFGGIVTYLSGRWVYSDKESKDLEDDISNGANVDL